MATRREAMDERDVLNIGGGPAGRSVVHLLNKADRKLSVTLVKDEPVNVNRCAVPYGIPQERGLERYRIPNRLVTDFGAELVIDRVESIRPDTHEVATIDGRRYRYRKLVLATGARPLIPAFPGVDATNVTVVRSLDDLVRLRDMAAGGGRAVIIGGGYIGIEVAVVLREMGLDVSIVEALPRILSTGVEPELIGDLEDRLESHEISVVTGTRVEGFEVESGRATSVRLSSGASIPCDFVVLSIGVRPETALAEASGLEVSDFGIVTDAHLRAGDPDIYVAGDCAAKHSFVTGKPTRGEFGTNAVFMARVVADNILGHETVFPGVINASASTVFDLSFGSAGLTEAAAREAGLDVVTGYSEVPDRYPMMAGVSPVKTKLVFERAGGRLVGGSVLRTGSGAAQNADFLSMAIQRATTLDDLLAYQYATHPELAAKPSDNMYVFAARAARDDGA